MAIMLVSLSTPHLLTVTYNEMKIRLWSIQEESKLIELEENGYLVASTNSCSPEWEREYKWMATQMKTKIGEPKNGEQYPIWSWFQYNNSKHKKPDLRRSAHLPSGTNGIRIEFTKLKNEVLLSDFELWHHPLSYKDYIGRNEQDSVRFEEELIKQSLESLKFDRLPTKIKHEIEDSWQRIFDMTFEDEYHTRKLEDKMIQACCWRIDKKEIVKIDKFIAR